MNTFGYFVLVVAIVVLVLVVKKKKLKKNRKRDWISSYLLFPTCRRIFVRTQTTTRGFYMAKGEERKAFFSVVV